MHMREAQRGPPLMETSLVTLIHPERGGVHLRFGLGRDVPHII